MLRSMTVPAGEWLARYAAELGLAPPDARTVESLLALAGTAAHASERVAAPISCWLAAAAAIPADRAREIADSLAAALASSDDAQS
jgi:Domain of unknown function (DUF6457)